MNFALPTSQDIAPILRLSLLAALTPQELTQLRVASAASREILAGREIVQEGQPVSTPRIVLSGWAYRQHVLQDGRRQILGLLLPGDLIGMCRQSNPVASTSVVSLTAVTLCDAPQAAPGSALAEAYAVSGAIDELYHLRHITRLGRMDAYERIADWLLELRERLEAVGAASETSFPLPMTQETLADVLGLTSVHINRTLQNMRRDGALELRGGRVKLLERDRLEHLVTYRSPAVCR